MSAWPHLKGHLRVLYGSVIAFPFKGSFKGLGFMVDIKVRGTSYE